jgi:hypothetical protein
MSAMATVALRTSLDFVAGILRRYGLSLGHGALTVCLGVAVFLSGDPWTYGPILWGLVSAQACLLGFWIALAARPWQTRMAYGGLHLVGLMFSVLAAGQMRLDPHWFDPFDVLRDVPALLVSTFVAGWLLRRRGWQLFLGAGDGRSDIAPGARRLQIPLGDFIKWFTLLCIALGLSVSLLPPGSVLLDDWLWRSRMSHYAEFLLAVCLPAGFLASLIFVGALVRTHAELRRLTQMTGIWCVVTLLWISAVIVGLNLIYNAYYFVQSPTRPLIQLPRLFVSLETISYGLPGYSCWSLAALVGALFVVAVTAVLAGWRMQPDAKRTSQLG